MNNELINYAFLSGFLESSFRLLADDYLFEKMETRQERREYINKIIAEAHRLAKDNTGKISSL